MRSFFLLLFLLPALAGTAQDSSYQQLLDRWGRDHQFSGVVLVAKSGRLLWSGATGMSDREAARKLRTTTPFRMGGLTKAFTAVMVLQLQEEGKLRLDDPIGKHLPGYTGPGGKEVTIFHLLANSSGLPDCGGSSILDIDRRPLALDSFIRRFCGGTLAFEPGTQYRETNSDYILLGKIIENASGMDYAENLRRRMLVPLRLNATGVLNDATPVAGLARTYYYKDSASGLVPDKPWFSGNYYGAGSLYSTAFDLLRFDAALFGNQLLRDRTVRLLTAGNEKLGNATLGMHFSGSDGALGKPYVYRSGVIGGNRAHWVHLPDSGLAFVILSNTDRGDLMGLTRELYERATATGVGK